MFHTKRNKWEFGEKWNEEKQRKGKDRKLGKFWGELKVRRGNLKSKSKTNVSVELIPFWVKHRAVTTCGVSDATVLHFFLWPRHWMETNVHCYAPTALSWRRGAVFKVHDFVWDVEIFWMLYRKEESLNLTWNRTTNTRVFVCSVSKQV